MEPLYSLAESATMTRLFSSIVLTILLVQCVFGAQVFQNDEVNCPNKLRCEIVRCAYPSCTPDRIIGTLPCQCCPQCYERLGECFYTQ